MKRLVLFALVTVCFLKGADAAGSFYMSVGAGAVFPSRNSSTTNNSFPLLENSSSSGGISQITLMNVNWRNQYPRLGYAFNAAFGRHIFTNLRIEGEFVYQNIKRSINGSYDWVETNQLTGDLFVNQLGNPITASSDHAELYAFMLNLYYDFKNSSKWTPWIGVGIGPAWVRSPNTHVNGQLAFDDLTVSPPVSGTVNTVAISPTFTGSVLALQLKMGVDWKVTDKVAITTLYRLIATSSFVSTGSNIITNAGTDASGLFSIPWKTTTGFLNNSVDVNLTYDFG